MSRYSWATGKDDTFVICHKDLNEMHQYPYGICSPYNGAGRMELIEILEEQDNNNQPANGT